MNFFPSKSTKIDSGTRVTTQLLQDPQWRKAFTRWIASYTGERTGFDEWLDNNRPTRGDAGDYAIAWAKWCVEERLMGWDRPLPNKRLILALPKQKKFTETTSRPAGSKTAQKPPKSRR